jgi:hypothetical protein
MDLCLPNSLLTGWQGMLSPPIHLIPLLVCPAIFVCSQLWSQICYTQESSPTQFSDPNSCLSRDTCPPNSYIPTPSHCMSRDLCLFNSLIPLLVCPGTYGSLSNQFSDPISGVSRNPRLANSLIPPLVCVGILVYQFSDPHLWYVQRSLSVEVSDHTLHMSKDPCLSSIWIHFRYFSKSSPTQLSDPTSDVSRDLCLANTMTDLWYVLESLFSWFSDPTCDTSRDSCLVNSLVCPWILIFPILWIVFPWCEISQILLQLYRRKFL